MKTTTPRHTIENGFCTICNDTEEWLLTRNQHCEYTVKVEDVEAGAYLITTTSGSTRYATIAIGSITRDGDTVTLHAAQAAFNHPAGTLVTVTY